MVIHVRNFINGEFVDSKSYIDVFDYTGKDILAKVPDADGFEVRKLRRAIGEQQEKIKSKPFDERAKIVKIMLDDYLSDKIFVKKVAMLRGTPVKHIVAPLSKLKEWIENIDDFMKVVFGSKKNFVEGESIVFKEKEIGRKTYQLYQPTFVALSGNMDSFEQFFVLAQGILAGSHLVVRASTRDFVTFHFFELMKKHGFPEGGQLITWDSKKPESTGFVRMLLESVKHAVMFGSTKTINSIIYEKDENRVITRDYSKDVKLSRYGSGLPVIIVTKNADISQAAKLVIEGCIDARGAHCISTTPVFVEKAIKEKFVAELKKQSKNYKDSDPTNNNSDFGRYNEKELKNLEIFISEVKENAEIIQGKLDKKSHSMDLVIIDNMSAKSKILREEIVGTVLGIIGFDELAEVTDISNNVLKERDLRKHLLTVVHGNEEEWLFVKKRIDSHVVRRNVNSADINLFLPHQGSYFILGMVDFNY